MANDAHEDPAFQAMCREHDIEGTAQVALCGEFWNRALVSGAGAEPQCVVRMAEGAREPEFVSWNAFPVGSHKLYAAPGAAIAAREQEAGDEAFRLKKLAGQMVAPVGRGYAEGWKAGYDAALASRGEAPATPKAEPGDWGIDHSAGRPILVHKNCSVIEAEDAEYVLRLIAADRSTPPAAIPAAPREVTADVHALAKKSGAAVRWRMGTKENPASPCEFRFTPEQLAIFAAALTQPAPVAAPAPVLCPNGEPWDDNPDGIVPGQDRGPHMNSDTGFWEGAEADQDGSEQPISWKTVANEWAELAVNAGSWVLGLKEGRSTPDNVMGAILKGIRRCEDLCALAASDEEEAKADEAIAAGHTPGDSVPGVSTAALVRALARANSTSTAAPAPASEAVACRIAMYEGAREPVLLSWNAFPVGEHNLYLASPGDSVDAPVQQAGELMDEQITAIHSMPYVRGCLLEYVQRPRDEEASAIVKAIAAQIAALKGEQPEPSGSERGEV